MNYVEKLRDIASKYKNDVYNELEFQDALNSIISLMSEIEYATLRNNLTSLEGELERVNYLINKKERKEKVLDLIIRLKSI